jgi:hypothetical protein
MPLRTRDDAQQIADIIKCMEGSLYVLDFLSKPENKIQLYLFPFTQDYRYKINNLPRHLGYVIERVMDNTYPLTKITDVLRNVSPKKIWGSIFFGENNVVTYTMSLTSTWSANGELDDIAKISASAKINELCLEWVKEKLNRYKTNPPENLSEEFAEPVMRAESPRDSRGRRESIPPPSWRIPEMPESQVMPFTNGGISEVPESTSTTTIPGTLTYRSSSVLRDGYRWDAEDGFLVRDYHDTLFRVEDHHLRRI